VKKEKSCKNLESTLKKVNDVLVQYPHLQKYFPFIEVNYMSKINEIVRRCFSDDEE